MGSVWIHKAFRKYLLMSGVFFFLALFPGWSAGYQEEKLFDQNVYSAEELKKKIDGHKIEIQVIDDQIKAFKTDSDWLLLKINQIQDSGRTAPPGLKQSLLQKEKNIETLKKNKGRLASLIRHYSARSEIQVKDIKAAPQPRGPVISKKTGTKTSVSRQQLQAAVEKSGLKDWVQITGLDCCLRLETNLPILFPTGSATLAKEYKSFFQKLAELLKPYDVKILVYGYTDPVPINNKKYPSNFELGATRATNVVHQLVGYGLKPSIFKIESTGPYRFAAKKKSPQNAIERRAEVTVIFSG